ncbi:MAG TPA: GntR family transcriptional regulator [Tepidisphaeraceae bacterium]|jgi:GntR family transcriptional regulator
MFLRIESSSGVPINRQIADQIRGHTVSGVLQPGDRLPSVRQLAKELAVNPNTILHVYEKLTAEGLLERRQGDGTFVADSLPRGRAKLQQELLSEELDRVARRALDLDLTGEALHELLDQSLARAQKRRLSRKG